MSLTLSLSLTAVRPEDVQHLIQVGGSEDPDAALNEYIDQHRAAAARCLECALAHHEALRFDFRRLGGLNMGYADQIERFRRELAPPEGDRHASPPGDLGSTRSDRDRSADPVTITVHSDLDHAIPLFELAREIYRHSRQTEVVMADVYLVWYFASQNGLTAAQIHRRVARKPDEITLARSLRSVVFGLPGGSPVGPNSGSQRPRPDPLAERVPLDRRDGDRAARRLPSAVARPDGGAAPSVGANRRV